MPRKRVNGGLSDQVPKKGRSVKYYCWCKANGGPHVTFDMVECCKRKKDGSLKDTSAKSFDSSKKPWQKKTSSRGNQMVYLTKKVGKLKNTLKKAKPKNLSKKHAHDSLDCDSNSVMDGWSTSPGIHVDKRLKLDKPVGIDLKSTDTHPIKVSPRYYQN